MAAYIIAIGGTGAKVAEAIVHAGAAGMFTKRSESTEDVQILFVDPDKGNGNSRVATRTIEIYKKCQNLFNSNQNIPWMGTKIESLGGSSPFNKADERLRDYFKYDNYSDEKTKIRHLFDVLYTKGERDLKLHEGFRGRPAIGAAIMSLINNQSAWSTLENKIRDDISGRRKPKIFLCGSIFGGTGASGFPTLARLIAEEFNIDNNSKSFKLGGLLMLPYFQFPVPRNLNEQTEIYARSEEFILKTKAALDYYGNQRLKLDKVYLLGTQNLTNIDNFSTGGSSQCNQPHFLELFAAGAFREFLFKEESNQLGLLARQNDHYITWDDIPDQNEVKKHFVDAVRFAFAWISSIVPDLDFARTQGKLQAVRYALKFFDNASINDNNEQDQILLIKEWCENYLSWISAIHSSAGNNSLKLFNINAFPKPEEGKSKKDEFPNLVVGTTGVAINRILEKLNSEKNKRGGGTVELAKALYKTISYNQ